MGAGFIDVIDGYFTCEFTTLSRTGSPQTWPLAARLLPDGRFLLSTSIGLPQKAFNIRRNPRVSLLFSNPTGSGVAKPGAVLVQGDATAEDRIVTDLTADPELAAYVETICARQPASAFMSSRLGRRMFWAYYMRILIYVTPRRALHWPDLDFTRTPVELDLGQVRRVV
jgi:Pyridoxamine 5'-phosphate oxidase